MILIDRFEFECRLGLNVFENDTFIIYDNPSEKTWIFQECLFKIKFATSVIDRLKTLHHTLSRCCWPTERECYVWSHVLLLLNMARAKRQQLVWQTTWPSHFVPPSNVACLAQGLTEILTGESFYLPKVQKPHATGRVVFTFISFPAVVVVVVSGQRNFFRVDIVQLSISLGTMRV